MTHTAEIESLWSTYHDTMLRYVRSRMPADQAEDLVQDTFVKALDAIHRGKGHTEHASGWLFRVAHNLVIDRYRARDREPELVELDATIGGSDADEHHHTMNEEVAMTGPTPHEQAETSILFEEAVRAIGTLQDEQRLVIVRSLQGYEYDEIATELGKSYGAVKAQHRRGIMNLRTRFGVIPVPHSRTSNALCAKKCGPKPGRKLRKPSPLALRVHDLLLKHGPMLPSSLATILDKPSSNIHKFFADNPQTFVIVGYGDSRGHKARVWGIKGVHDVQEAA